MREPEVKVDTKVMTNNTNTVFGNEAMVVRPRLYQRLIRSNYLRNNVLLLAGGFLSGVCNLLLHPVLSRLLGPDGYGTMASMLALLGILLLPIQVVSTVVIKYSSSLTAVGQLAQLNDFIRRLTYILLPSGILIALIVIAASGFISSSLRLPVQGVIILAGAFVVAFAAQVNLGALQGLERFAWFSSLGVLGTVLRFVLASALVFLGLGVNGAILGVVLSIVLGYVISFLPLRALFRGTRLHSGPLRSLWSYSLTAVVAGGSTTLLLSVDTIMAKAYLPAHEAGLYAALATLGKVVLFVSSSILVVMFPRVAALHHRQANTTHVVLQSLLGMLMLSAAVELVFLIAPIVVIRLMFGPDFVAVSGQLVWYGLAMLMFALAQPLGTYFLAIGNRVFALVVAACCVVQAILIVPRHSTINEIVQAVIVSHTMLFILLLALFVFYMSRNRQLSVAA